MSFYFYRQHDAMQCGIACMAMVCKYYGRIYLCETLSKTRLSCHYCHPSWTFNLLIYKVFMRNVKMTAK
nr:cysteine peptidase family C39 domain-containing protein [Prevotella denticola]